MIHAPIVSMKRSINIILCKLFKNFKIFELILT